MINYAMAKEVNEAVDDWMAKRMGPEGQQQRREKLDDARQAHYDRIAREGARMMAST